MSQSEPNCYCISFCSYLSIPISAPTSIDVTDRIPQKDEVLTAAIELTVDLYQQNYVLMEERKILWICVGILFTSFFVF